MTTRVTSDVGSRWETVLDVDQEDPYFFDHPLDHLPAMLLLEGVLRTAERAAAETAPAAANRHLARLHLEFRRFGELRPAPVAGVWADPQHRWHVELRQNAAQIAGGDLRWGTAARPGSSATRTDAVEPVAAHLVHRSRPENVLIGGFRQVGVDTYRAELLAPPAGHYFRRRDPVHRPVGELVEGVRQFGTMLGHLAREVRTGMRFVARSLDIELTRPVRRGEPVSVRTRALPGQRRSGTGTMAFTLHVGAEQVGAASATGSVVSPRVYARMRGR